MIEVWEDYIYREMIVLFSSDKFTCPESTNAKIRRFSEEKNNIGSTFDIQTLYRSYFGVKLLLSFQACLEASAEHVIQRKFSI